MIHIGLNHTAFANKAICALPSAQYQRHKKYKEEYQHTHTIIGTQCLKLISNAYNIANLYYK